MESVMMQLLALREEGYAGFQRALLPTVDPAHIIGVRTPALRKLAKEMARDGRSAAFLAELPHASFEENQLHAFLLAELREFDACLAGVERFLPFVDNWATCDQLSPKVFRREAERLLPAIDRWLQSAHPYTVRFGIGMLMQHFLTNRFDPAYAARVAAIHSEEYYVNMEIAWYLATALAMQWETTVPYLTEGRLTAWVHRKTIQKAVESCRITPEQKAYLKTLRKIV